MDAARLFLIGLVALGLAGLAQLIFVPAAAASRGKDAGLWLLITICWLAGGWASGAALVMGGSAILAFTGILGMQDGDAANALAIGIGLAAFAIMSVLLFLPSFAVRLGGSGRSTRTRRYGRSRGRSPRLRKTG